jgi:hypothetical protein
LCRPARGGGLEIVEDVGACRDDDLLAPVHGIDHQPVVLVEHVVDPARPDLFEKSRVRERLRGLVGTEVRAEGRGRHPARRRRRLDVAEDVRLAEGKLDDVEPVLGVHLQHVDVLEHVNHSSRADVVEELAIRDAIGVPWARRTRGRHRPGRSRRLPRPERDAGNEHDERAREERDGQREGGERSAAAHG